MRYFAIFARSTQRSASTAHVPATEQDLAPIVPGAFAAWWARTTPDTPSTVTAARVHGSAARSQGRPTAA